MKLMCIKNISFDGNTIAPITPGRIYESLKEVGVGVLNVDTWLMDMNYRVLNDDGFSSWELTENFIPLEEWRHKQLNKVINGDRTNITTEWDNRINS